MSGQGMPCGMAAMSREASRRRASGARSSVRTRSSAPSTARPMKPPIRAPGPPATRSGLRGPVGREAAGGDRAPGLDGDPDQRLALAAHRLAVLVPVGVLAGDAAEVLDQPVLGLLPTACRAPRRCRRPAPRRRPTRRSAPARRPRGRGAGSPPWRGRGTSRSRSGRRRRHPPVTGETCGRPSRRVVTRVSRWRVRAKSRSWRGPPGRSSRS